VLGWLRGTIPIWFHMDVAAFIFVVGVYKVRRPPAAAPRPAL